MKTNEGFNLVDEVLLAKPAKTFHNSRDDPTNDLVCALALAFSFHLDACVAPPTNKNHTVPAIVDASKLLTFHRQHLGCFALRDH